MKFYYGKQQMCDLNRAQEQNYLATNGLGGYSCVTSAFGVNRCDMGILVAAKKAPNVRITLVHRMQEVLEIGGKEYWLSTQEFADGSEPENGSAQTALSSLAAELAKEPPVGKPQIQRKRILQFSGIAAAAVVVFALVLLKPGVEKDTLQDTFEDPYLAYAQVEEAFRQISRKMTVGVEMIADAKPLAERPMEILNNVMGNKN